jgi:hypothetical protein
MKFRHAKSELDLRSARSPRRISAQKASILPIGSSLHQPRPFSIVNQVQDDIHLDRHERNTQW